MVGRKINLEPVYVLHILYTCTIITVSGSWPLQPWPDPVFSRHWQGFPVYAAGSGESPGDTHTQVTLTVTLTADTHTGNTNRRYAHTGNANGR